MTPISLKLPEGATVVGEILRDYSGARARLSQDILQVSLPDGVVIDVGWRPRFDPNGEFQITVFRGEWENQIQPPICEKSPQEVARFVNQLAWQYGNRRFPRPPFRFVTSSRSVSVLSPKQGQSSYWPLVPA